MPDLPPLSPTSVSGPRKLMPHEHIIAGLPIALVLIGGAIGGACGGCAYSINSAILKNDWPPSHRYLLTTLVSLGAVVMYFGIVVGLALTLPGFFKK